MHQEKYSLSWHAYSDHLRSMMKELMTNEDFSDVTLVTEDKEHIKANINILSTCSPVFKNILMKEKNSNHVVGVQYSEMESIMQFIYLGEATLYEERMDEFLAVAKTLEIKELCNAETKAKLNETFSPCDPVTSIENFEEQTVMYDQMKIQENTCEFSSINKRYECDQCHKTYSARGALYTHKRTAHQGVMYPCDQCDFQATQQRTITAHIQSIHELVKFTCDHCDYQATQQNTLTKHIKSKHEGVNYECDQCGYKANARNNLKTHIEGKHEGVKHACDQCNYMTSWKTLLTKHKRENH